MSDGGLLSAEQCSSFSFSSSSVFLLVSGVSGAVFGLLLSQFFGFGEAWWGEGSWLLLACLFVYAVFPFLLLFYLSGVPGADCGDAEEISTISQYTPKHPNRLQRLRSYLAFFPITHVIQSDNGGEGQGQSQGQGQGQPRYGNYSDCLSSDVDEPGGLTGRISAQMDMAIDAILSEYVSPWYTKISDDGSFLDQCKVIIRTAFLNLGERLRQVDRNELAKDAIQIIHVHWKEYTDAVNKSREGSAGSNGEEMYKSFRFVHSFLQDNKEVSRRYQQIVSKILKELAVPDLNSAVMCQFLAGILVKNFIQFYVEMLVQPSWVNGTLMSLLSSGSMSVDITGSSSQNSSSPASPLPDISAKQVHLFGDEAMAECESLCPSGTGDESPTKKSCSSQSIRSGASGSQEEFSARSQQSSQQNAKPPRQQHSMESNSSQSVDEGTSSEPKTESSAHPSPIGKIFDEDLKWSSSTSSSSMFPSEILHPLSQRPRDLTPLRSGSGGPMKTVTTALGRVMQATAFPLLPSECYSDEDSPLKVIHYGGTIEQSSMLLEEFGGESTHDGSDIPMNDNENVFEPSEDVHTPEDTGRDEAEEDIEEIKQSSSKTVASHYYSFDEASKPKPTPASLFETSTLSLDGAMEGKKQAKDQLQLCSHEYRSDPGDPSGNGKPHRSPVYEEPEDFAASIAKLRSLLEQKERKSSTPPLSANLLAEDGDVFESPSDSPALGSGGGGGNIGIPQISETCASDTHTTPSSTSSMDISKGSSRFSFNETILIQSESDSTSIEPPDGKNFETVPEIKCCFRNVSIPKVESSAEAGGQSIYYCIQYEGVYFDDYETHPQKLVYRTTTIKRKFKEFLTLQAHLEENIACKPHLKGIKTPTRWLNVSLTKSDATVAHQRRAMLEKYLQQLCYHHVVGFCQEVLIFMAYGEDGFCSFEVGDPKDLLTHRLDKLARKFTGVFNSLKDALPSFELDLSPAPNTPKSEGITPSDPKQGGSFPSFPFQEKYSGLGHHKTGDGLEGSWMEKLSEGWTTSSENPGGSSGEVNEKGVDGDVDSPTSFHPHSDVDGGKLFSVYPLASAVTHLLCDVLWLPQYKPHPTSVATFMSISGKSLEHYVMETMDIFLSEEAILGYLEWLTVSVSTAQSESDSQRGDVTGDLLSEQDLKNIVKRRIPAWVRWMWGRNRLELTIDRITGLFQSPLVNHDLVLSLSELLFSKMVTLVDDNDAE